MRFGLFHELQLPKPWHPGAEHRLFKEALEQIELADRLGFDYVWMVEHHFLEEYSHSSAPEVFLGAVSQRTERIRIGHGIMALPPAVNPAPRVAERIATLDLVSDGRVEFGTGEGSTEVELDGFGVPRGLKHEQWAEALDAVTRMFVEEPFAGYAGQHVRMPPRNVVPKPHQKPHPPLWVSCSYREKVLTAARNGLGALTVAFAAPEEAQRWVADYYATLASDQCVPAGFSVNPNVAMTAYLMCHQDERTAMERGLDGHYFFARSLAYYFHYGSPAPGRTALWDEFGIGRSRSDPPASVDALDFGGAYAAVGPPERVRASMRRYEAAGVDQMLLICQTGRIPHEHVCESMGLFAREVMPEFHDRHEAAQARKRESLAPAIEAALARREPAREAPADYRVPPVNRRR
ncbi:MAG: LLM class flavin-dependent oxidoreductase [Micromonosporaceae bacterium]|nr:LLM class flavin-dependent oxidoreductase [Micromonosporaceae bacterium]